MQRQVREDILKTAEELTLQLVQTVRDRNTMGDIQRADQAKEPRVEQ